MPYIKTSRGLDIHYELQGKGECLLFLHGWGANRRIWRQQIDYFTKNFTVVNIDLPGHGRSSWTKVSLKDIAYDIESLVYTLGLSPINMVGSSLGGLVALKFTELFPHLVKRLIFVDTLPKFVRTKSFPFGLEPVRIRHLKDQLGVDYPIILNVFFRSLFTINERRSCRIAWLKQFRQGDDVPQQEALYEYLCILEKEDLRSVLKSIKIPVMFFNGTQDYICSKEAVEFLSKHISRARVYFFEGCGHFPFLTKPREFNENLNNFLLQP